ncbi:MAG TPA: hypothetical protein VFJ85_11475 [Acidimicrobiales bacterium]|nr:hypothetical protein [Acidimicrobiales bacterium]
MIAMDVTGFWTLIADARSQVPDPDDGAAIAERVNAILAAAPPDVASRAYRAVTGQDVPRDRVSISYPELDPSWDFDFDDWDQLRSRLPRLVALYQGHHGN